MAYRISATTAIATVVSVVVETAEEATAKIADYKEEGYTDIKVSDMHGFEIDPRRLHPGI
jgi:hypothetical protein